MPAVKRRKVAAPAGTVLTAGSPRGIHAFTKVSKTTIASKDLFEKTVQTNAPAALYVDNGVLDKKRKAVDVDVYDDELDSPAHEPVHAPNHAGTSKRSIKPLPRRPNTVQLPQTPHKPICELENTPADTPTRGARSLLDNFFISSSSPIKIQSSPLWSHASSFTELESSICESSTEDEMVVDQNALPAELLELISLHASFLTALSLHYAHNGTHTPADLRLLTPNIARSWGKRKVMLDDVRRILGVLNTAIPEADIPSNTRPISTLSLSDYGQGKICIEIGGGLGRSRGMARPLDEQTMNVMFREELERLWKNTPASKRSSTVDFINNLPFEPIVTCASLIKMSPLLAKGQRRLEDLKSGIIIKQAAENESNASARAIRESKGLQRRGTGLLDRLRAKEQQQAALPAPPTKAELSRLSALHRLSEVISVITILSTSTSGSVSQTTGIRSAGILQARMSFTMPTLLGKLRDSFKTPIAMDEGEACIRLLAAEVAPEWLKVTKMGKTDAVVVNREHRPNDVDVQKRIRLATAP